MMSVCTQTILSQFSIVLYFIIITSISHYSHINMDMVVRFDINSTEIIVLLFPINVSIQYNK